MPKLEKGFAPYQKKHNPYQNLDGFQRMMEDLRVPKELPKNSIDVYHKAMGGLMEEAERLGDMSALMDTSSDTAERASIAQKRGDLLKKMIDVEKTKSDLLKQNMDIDTVIFAVFQALTTSITEVFDEMLLTPDQRDTLRIDFFTRLKSKSQGLRDKVDQSILEVREQLPKIENKKAG